VREYLLSLDHPEGRSKARAFAAVGYSPNDWRLFAMQLGLLARDGIALSRGMNRFGRKYKVDGILRSPAGEGFGIRTIWIVHFGEDFPRLVTAYPRTQR
jgi:hypothetical protein